MNFFTRHPRAQWFSFGEHRAVAMGITRRLLSSVTAFVLHAVMPIIPIEPQLDLEAGVAFLEALNRYLSTAAAHKKTGAVPEVTAPVERIESQSIG